MLTLERYSLGVGDRFAQQAEAQLRAFILAAEKGVDIAPVWNKSDREHLIVGSEPSSVTAAAETAGKNSAGTIPGYVDADHIRLETVDRFVTLFRFLHDRRGRRHRQTLARRQRRGVCGPPSRTRGRMVIPGIARRLKTSRTYVAAS